MFTRSEQIPLVELVCNSRSYVCYTCFTESVKQLPYWPTPRFPTINSWSSHVFVAYVDFLRSHARTSPKHEISSYFTSFATSSLPYVLLSFAGVCIWHMNYISFLGIQQKISTSKRGCQPTNFMPFVLQKVHLFASQRPGWDHCGSPKNLQSSWGGCFLLTKFGLIVRVVKYAIMHHIVYRW